MIDLPPLAAAFCLVEMAAISDKADNSLAPFISPVSMVGDQRAVDGNVTDSAVALSRGRNERKSIVAERRMAKNGIDSIGVRPQKSQSAGDLPSFRIRSSASVSFGNGTVPSSLPSANSNGTRFSGIDPSSEKHLADNSAMTTATKPSDSNQHRHKTESAAALATVSSSALHDLATSMNISDVSGEVDVGRKLAHRERRFRRLFRNVPTTEVLLCRYSCAYVSAGLLLHGHLYVSNCWICFHSNIFGIEKIIEIPAESVISVSKAKTAKIIPNAVKIKTEGKYYLFGSLISRDNTYRLLVNVTSRARGVGDNGVAKHDFTGGPYGNVSRTLRDCAGEFDEVTSSSSSLSTEASSSSYADETGVKSKFVRASTPALNSSTVEEAEPVIWRRFFHSASEAPPVESTQATGRPKEKSKGNGLRKSAATNSSIPALLTWFFGLPKTLTILIVCVGLVMFLFLCATILTIRLIYVRSSGAFRMEFSPWNSEHTADSILLSNRALDNMGALLDNSLKVMDEVKGYLESLRVEVRNGLDEAATALSDPGS